MNDTRTGRDVAHEEFVRPGALPEGANLPDAEARLLAALETELGVPLAAPVVTKPVLRLVSTGRLKPLLAFAAVFLAAAGLVWSLGSLRGDRAVMRGAPERGGWSADARATKLDARRTRLTWQAAPQATSYEVTFLSASLDEVAHVERLPAATYVLDRDALPAGRLSGQSVLWRVTAKAGGDAIARSPAAPLLVP
jgi:hypothetical protein